MKSHRSVSATIVTVASLLFVGCTGTHSSTAQPSGTTSAAHETPSGTPVQATQPVPPYFQTEEVAGTLPRVLPATYFQSYPTVARAYRAAKSIPGVIVQQPRYCHCDKMGHNSLLVRLVAFGSLPAEHEDRKCRVILLGHIRRYLQDYLRQYWNVLCHAQFKDPAFGFLAMLEKANRGQPRTGTQDLGAAG
jgi:hypothetical protein